MPNSWPDTPPIFPNDFNEKQVGSLRALTRHAVGMRNKAYVFPDWHDGRTAADADEAEIARKRKWVDGQCKAAPLLTRYDVENFNSRSYNSDFKKDPDQRHKLQRIYYYIYFFVLRYQEAHRPLWTLALNVYFPTKMTVGDLSVGLHQIFDVDEPVIEATLPRISGVYYLYRYGVVTEGIPEVIRSVVKISLHDSGVKRRLRFTLHYLGGDFQQKGDRFDIEGIVLPHDESRLFVAAIDGGTKNSPCLLILDRPRGRELGLTGLMLRRNTLGKSAATRVYLKIVSSPTREETPEELETLYENHKANADILSYAKRATEREIKEFEERIDNKVDMKKNFMLAGWEGRKS
jgi:hypothetical protein